MEPDFSLLLGELLKTKISSIKAVCDGCVGVSFKPISVSEKKTRGGGVIAGKIPEQLDRNSSTNVV